MRFKSFISMGVAAVLIVPTLITAANPELAYAKTSKASSKKISTKAKSVIAKIKAINPKRSDYIAKTKSAVSAYKKLSSKDKKMVYNYGTLKKHWSKIQPSLKKITYLNKKVATLNSKNYATKIATLKKQYDGLNRITKAAVPKTTVKKLNYYANRKASLVVAQIKAINPKKSDYVVKTKSALSAYNKLSKTDKKKVTNYSALKKHWTNIQPYLKKISSFSKSVATLNTKNFATKSVAVEKQYENLDAITKAAVPSTTLKKLSYYSDVVSTKNLVFKTAGNSGSTTADSTDGTVIMNIINAYKKLSGAQQTLLRDLLDDTDQTQEPRLDRYIALEDVVKPAAEIEKQYVALKPISKSKATNLVNLYNDYFIVSNESKSYMPNKVEIDKLGTSIYKEQIDAANKFIEDVAKITNVNNIKNVISDYNKIQKPNNYPSTIGYPLLAPIDLVDKNTITTYKKYEPVPDIIAGFDGANLKPLSQITWAGSGEESTKSLLTSAQIAKLAELLPKYNKLGSNQKVIVQNEVPTNAKDYLSEGKNLTSAQAIDKSHASAIKNKAKSSYFADLKKVYDAYAAATSDVKRFVVNAKAINGITSSGSDYSKALIEANALKQAIEALNENSKLADINAVVGKYKILSNQVPTPISLVDASTLKTYNQFATIPDVVKSVKKIPNKAEPTEGNAYGFNTNNIKDILTVIKPYKKLGNAQQVIVDKETNHVPSIASLAEDESYIKEAQKIDSAYLKLKKSSKTYPKDAKKVNQSYDDASDDVIKYLVYKDKIAKLKSAFEKPQKIADDFAALVIPLNKNSKIDDVNKAVTYYNDSIASNTQASDLVDKAVMKKYNEYAPVSNVVKLLSLINQSKVDSDYIPPTDVYYIQKSTIAYVALKPEPKMIIDAADRTKFPFLYETKNILDAIAIDKAYEKIKPTDAKYELELINIYRERYVSAPNAQRYVTHKKEFDNIEKLYKEPLEKAEEFETSVRKMSHVSESNGTPTMEMVRNLEAKYYDLINYNKFGTKYKFPLKDLIDDEVLKEYNKFALVLKIQDIAKTLYVSYGKLFNDENVDFDYVKDSFYCKKAESSSDQNVKNEYKDNCTRKAEYLADSNKYKVGYTASNSRYGQPIKITNPNDIKLIYYAIDYFQQLDSTQVAILKKAPSSQKDYYYEDRYKGKHAEKYEEKEIVHPSIPMSDGEIKNFLKAQEIDKAYEALSPSSKTYIQDAIVLYYKFYKAGTPVQLYVVHDKEIRAFENSYKMGDIIAGVDNFVKAVNLLSNSSSIEAVKNGKSGKDGGIVDQYNNLNEAQLAVIDQGILTKYNAYAPIAEIKELTDKIIKDTNGKYTESSINNMIKAIAIYKKLTKDPKSIVTNKINSSDLDATSYKYLLHETEIKAAQKVDNAFKKLEKDKTDDKYVTNLKKVAKDYEALNDLNLKGLSGQTAQAYVISDINGALKKAIYSTPKGEAEEFEKLIEGGKRIDGTEIVAWLDRKAVPYKDIANAVTEYNKLSTKAKSLVDDDVMKIYNKYAPVVTIVGTLKITTPVYSVLDDSSTDVKKHVTGYYKNNTEADIGSQILNAIQLYNKLGSDQKEIVLYNGPDEDNISYYPLAQNQLDLLKETDNIKAAQALDKKITAIKPKSTSYVKGVIDAQKTLNVMPKEQRVYIQNADILKGYLVDIKTNKPTQTQKAIDDLTEFENGVKQVDQWTSEMKKDENGNIGATCTDTTEPCNTAITKKMGELATLFNQLNTPRIIDGSEVKLASLIDRTILARYQYFRAIYDVIDKL